MIRLEELLYSLTTVIIRYHDSLALPLIRASNKTEMHLKSRELATAIINDRDQDFKLKLNELIQNCTKGYPGRRPFLSFMLNEIVLIHSFLNKKNSFSPEEFIEYKAQIFRLLMDFKGLLTTIKGKTYSVTQHKTEINPEGVIDLYGCINDGYTGNEFCNSGIFLKEEILEILNIKISFVEEKYREFAERICTEHQNALLVPELLAKLHETELARSAEQQKIIELSTPKTPEPQPVQPDQSEEIRKLEEIIQQQKLIIQKSQETQPVLPQSEQSSQLLDIIHQQKLALDQHVETITDLRRQVQAKDAAILRRQFGLGVGFSPNFFPLLGKFPSPRVDERATQDQDHSSASISDFDDPSDIGPSNFGRLETRQ